MRVTSIYSYLHPLWSCARNAYFSWEENPVLNYRSFWRYVSFTYYVQLTVVGHIQHIHAAQILKGHEFRGWGCWSCLSHFQNSYLSIWCGFDRASSLICGNKIPTRYNRWFLLQILLFAQHVSGNIMPIIRSSRILYKWLLPVVFGALVFKLSVWCGAEGARNMLSKQ